MRLLFASLTLAAIATPALADEDSHEYKEGEPLFIYANKMGPFHNPLETYAFFELPGCPPADWSHKSPGLGQALVGDELYKMKTDAHFKADAPECKVCEFLPTAKDAAKWEAMVREQYWYQLSVDGLPIWASFGKMVQNAGLNKDNLKDLTIDGALKQTPMVYTHQSFRIGYNGDRVVFANLTVSNLVPIVADRAVSFTYDVKFESMPSVAFDDRYRRYLDNTFFEHRIHWFSIFNSFMLVLFLVGMVLIILSRTLRADYARFAKEARDDSLDGDWADECGWKLLHGDVFRAPPQFALLSALVGTGSQLAITAIILVVVAIISVVYTSPGSTATYGVMIYCGTGMVGGYVSARVVGSMALGGAPKSLGGTGTSSSGTHTWMRAMALTAGLFPGAVLLLGFAMNFVAIAYDSAQAIPAEFMLLMLVLWAVLGGLVFVGTFMGRHGCGANAASANPPPGSPTSASPITGKANSGAGSAQPHVNQIPRIVPDRPWYVWRSVLILAGGVLPFATIFIELYFVFTSFWNYKTYYVFGFMLLVLHILLAVTAAVSVVATYLLLNSEDHHWHWTSFLVGFSIAGYVFLYAVYFHLTKTRMTGFLMACYYYGYTGMLCVGIGLGCGAVAYVTASAFVSRIYRNVKTE